MKRLFYIWLFFGAACSGLPAAERLVSLSPALTELVFQLGQGGLLAGRSEVCDYPAGAGRLPVAGRFADPFLERLVKLRPTLLLTNDLRDPQMARQLRRLGIKVVRKQCGTIQEYREWVELLGRELNCAPDSRRELKRFDREISALRRLPPLSCSVLWVICEKPLMTAGRRSLLSEVSRLAGVKNVGDVGGQAYFRISRDFLLKNPPDVVVWAGSGTAPDEADVFWRELAAVRSGRVLLFMHEDAVMRPGPRLPSGIRKLRAGIETIMGWKP